MEQEADNREISDRQGAPNTPLLRVCSLSVRFATGHNALGQPNRWLNAVDRVDFELSGGKGGIEGDDGGKGETLGLVGESGCGKTTLGRSILRLIEPSSGQIWFEGRKVLSMGSAELRDLRRKMQLIFQDPGGSLNPRLRVWKTVSEPLLVHGLVKSKRELRIKAEELLERCGMPGASADRYPHEFSGGQRQRIAIARALALEPGLVVCDEPTSALDVSVQAQIMNLLKELQGRLGLSYLFISHDMAAISHMCDRIAVMRAGKIVEIGDRDQILFAPEHDYTKKLLAAVPRPEVCEPARE